MKQFFLKKWFLIGLVVCITFGISYGLTRPEGVDGIVSWINPRLLTALILFLMSLTLDSRQLQASFRAPAPVLTAVALNYLLVPAAAWALLSLQLTDDFRYGLMIAGSVPCTMAAASVWTRKAGGNDAVSLLVTLVTNALCFAVTPFWINLALPNGTAQLDGWSMVLRLVQAVLIPCALGQLLRQWRPAGELATRGKPALGAVAQVMVLVLVLFAALNAGGNLAAADTEMNLAAVAIVWGCCVAIHVGVLFLGFRLARILGFSWADSKAVAIAGSQKTLPIGVYIATDPGMFGGSPFAVFPMLMYHASQLFVDTAVADRWAGISDEAETVDSTVTVSEA